jgi:hypothetical protein
MTAKAGEVSASEIDLIGREAAYLSLLEIGLGGLLHGLHVPFTGYFLSLNQGFFLSRAVAQGRELPRARLIPASISSIAALLKSLSPAGKKLTPMLAISMQGVVFTSGTLVFGPSLPGVVVGSMLSSLWAFAQPLILYSVLYGQNLTRIAAFYEEKFHFLWVLGALVGVKALLGAGLAVAGYLMPERGFARYRDKMVAYAARGRVAKKKDAAPLRGALRDLLNPLFLASLVMTVAFFFFSEASFAEIAWQLLRPIAIGFVIFFAVRMISFERLIARLEHSKFKGMGRSLEAALRVVKDE